MEDGFADAFNQVEAMCNMGSTFKVMGLVVQAFEFWWKALHTQPTFWDVLVCDTPCGGDFVMLTTFV